MRGKVATAVFDGILRCFDHYIIPQTVFNFDLEKACHELKNESVKKKLTLSGAESMTGGLVSALITSVPGSSDYFLGAAVTYSVESKARLLCIDEELLGFKGVVSEWTAREMALGARKIFKSKLSFGITGYAGPATGKEEEEVGTVCFGFSMPFKNLTWKQKFSGSRNEVREQAAAFVIFGLYIMALNYHEMGIEEGCQKR